MSDVIRSYISKVFVNQLVDNSENVKITTEYLSPSGDVFSLDYRAISPNVIQTTSSLNELQPEVSTVYPYKSVTPIDVDGASIIMSPNVNTFPTASQNYYAPVYFERYNPNILRVIDKTFTELD
jgi:hypothetical protein